MKLAISIWNGRVAPVFDVSERCLILDDDEHELHGESVSFPGCEALEKAYFLEQKKVATLFCGAISREYEETLVAHGIEIISFIAGPVEQIIGAWKTGLLERASFSMPGCGCPRRRRCRRRNRDEVVNLTDTRRMDK